MSIDHLQVYSGYRRCVYVADNVMNTWQAHRQLRQSQPEAFGVLIGTTSQDKRTIWIDQVTTPMPGDVGSRYHFELCDLGHQTSVDLAYEQSMGSAIYLGTWHTHPQDDPSPSGVDKNDWRDCLKRNRQRPLLFVIAGIEETRLFVSWGCFFRTLRRGETDL